MAPVEDPVYEVRYKSVTRKLTRSELEQAPESLISKILLQDTANKGDRTLVIPSDGTAPGCAVWLDGNEHVFEVCVGCYRGGPESVVKEMVSPAMLAPAIVHFFNIPRELWPPGFRIAYTTLERKRDLYCLAQNLLLICVKQVEDALARPSVLLDSKLDGRSGFYLHHASRNSPRGSVTTVHANVRLEQVEVVAAGSPRSWDASQLGAHVEVSPALEKALVQAGQEMQLEVSIAAKFPAAGWTRSDRRSSTAEHGSLMVIDCKVDG